MARIKKERTPKFRSAVIVTSTRGKYAPLMPLVYKAAEAVMPLVSERKARVEIFLVTNAAIRKMNRKYRGKDAPTNVLSFEEPGAFPHPEEAMKHLGEVYLAPEYIASHREDIVYLAIHGILHLCGYTHESIRDKMKMEKKEKALMKLVK